MVRKSKKYDVIPGVEVPDIKSIVPAASDFSKSELDKVEIKKTVLEVSHKENISSKPSSEDISALNSLGNKVAENEEKQKLESKKKMESIKSKAVISPESIDSLSKRAQAEINDPEKLEKIQKDREERLAKMAEAKEKEKLREERRIAHKKKTEELTSKSGQSSSPITISNKSTSVKNETSKASNNSVVLSDEDTLESFSELL